jgi:putative toxin-antitoxin system antitoxin component (TIGR02293 family)
MAYLPIFTCAIPILCLQRDLINMENIFAGKQRNIFKSETKIVNLSTYIGKNAKVMKGYLIPEDIFNLIEEPTVASREKIIQASRRGVAREDFNSFARSIHQSVANLSKIIPASYSTLTKKATFDKATSEHIFKLAELYAYGRDIFGDVNTFNHWLQRESKPLGSVTPYSLLDTGYGIGLVMEELGRIDHGIFA